MKSKLITVVILTATFSLSLISTMYNTVAKAEKETEIKKSIEETTRLAEIEVEETSLEEITTFSETITIPTTTEEITTKKIRKKKKEISTETVTTASEPDTTRPKEQNTTKSNAQEQITQKETKKPKPNNTVPAYSENNGVIGSSNMTLIRNTIMSSVSGTYNSNMTNLAIYMARNGLSNAQSTVEKLCGYTTIKCSAKTATVTLPSTDPEDVIDAASKLAKKLSGEVGTYGIGLNASFKNNQYIIYAVVTIQK